MPSPKAVSFHRKSQETDPRRSWWIAATMVNSDTEISNSWGSDLLDFENDFAGFWWHLLVHSVCRGTEILLVFYLQTSNYWHYVTGKFPRELFRDVCPTRCVEVLRHEMVEYSKEKSRKDITLSLKNKYVNSVPFNGECNHIAGEPFTKKKNPKQVWIWFLILIIANIFARGRKLLLCLITGFLGLCLSSPEPLHACVLVLPSSLYEQVSWFFINKQDKKKNPLLSIHFPVLGIHGTFFSVCVCGKTSDVFENGFVKMFITQKK